MSSARSPNSAGTTLAAAAVAGWAHRCSDASTPEGATRLVEDAIRDLVLKGVEADVIGVAARMGVGDLLAEGVNGDDRFEAAEVAAAAATRPSGSGLLARSTSRASRSP